MNPTKTVSKSSDNSADPQIDNKLNSTDITQSSSLSTLFPIDINKVSLTTNDNIENLKTITKSTTNLKSAENAKIGSTTAKSAENAKISSTTAKSATNLTTAIDSATNLTTAKNTDTNPSIVENTNTNPSIVENTNTNPSIVENTDKSYKAATYADTVLRSDSKSTNIFTRSLMSAIQQEVPLEAWRYNMEQYIILENYENEYSVVSSENADNLNNQNDRYNTSVLNFNYNNNLLRGEKIKKLGRLQDYTEFNNKERDNIEYNKSIFCLPSLKSLKEKNSSFTLQECINERDLVLAKVKSLVDLNYNLLGTYRSK